MSGETVTIQVPRPLYALLRDRAQQRQHSVEDELAEALSTVMAHDDVSTIDETAITSLATLTEGELREIAINSHLSPTAAAYLEELHFKRQREDLTTGENQIAEVLLEQQERLMLRRAQAMALLKERGCDITSLLIPVAR